MQFYYSKTCPHSLSMMEILTRYNSFVNPGGLEMIDVKDRKTILPSSIKGTPAIVHDDQVYHGDYAFDLLSDLHGAISNAEVKQKPKTAIRGEPIDHSPMQEDQNGIAVCDDSAVAGLFDCDPMLPRS